MAQYGNGAPDSSKAPAVAPSPAPAAVPAVADTDAGTSTDAMQTRTTTCGGSAVTISYRAGNVFTSDAVINVQTSAGKKTFTDWSDDNFAASCQTGAGSKPYLVINASCGGAICDDNTYGVIDPATGAVVAALGAKTWQQLNASLGLHLDQPVEAFCCGKQAEQGSQKATAGVTP
jgi:hypothetical protein